MRIRDLNRALVSALRLLLIAVCVLPLANPRAVAGFLPPVQSERAPVSNLPIEEEDESERNDAEQRDAELRSERRQASISAVVGRLPVHAVLRTIGIKYTSHRSATEDPFHNGLGTHYRC